SLDVWSGGPLLQLGQGDGQRQDLGGASGDKVERYEMGLAKEVGPDASGNERMARRVGDDTLEPPSDAVTGLNIRAEAKFLDLGERHMGHVMGRICRLHTTPILSHWLAWAVGFSGAAPLSLYAGS